MCKVCLEQAVLGPLNLQTGALTAVQTFFLVLLDKADYISSRLQHLITIRTLISLSDCKLNPIYLQLWPKCNRNRMKKFSKHATASKPVLNPKKKKIRDK